MIGAKLGFFVIDNLVLGLDLNIALSTVKYGGDNYESSQNLFSAGPFIRYYIPTSKVLPFFELKRGRNPAFCHAWLMSL